MDNQKGDCYCFFWKGESPFSNFYTAHYELDGNTFSCTEQGFMHDKAIMFGDASTATQILQTSKPRTMKQLGRKVRGFDDETWRKHRTDIMYRHCWAKFSQNEHLKDALLKTGDQHMAEASPLDRIWGIGLNEMKARQRAPNTWPGSNLLGKVLDRVRAELREIDRRLEEEKKSASGTGKTSG